jgi:hypothetical protein
MSDDSFDDIERSIEADREWERDHPTSPPSAGTPEPRAVSEEQDGEIGKAPPMPTLTDLRGLVVMMVEDYDDGELRGSAAIVDALIELAARSSAPQGRGDDGGLGDEFGENEGDAITVNRSSAPQASGTFKCIKCGATDADGFFTPNTAPPVTAEDIAWLERAAKMPYTYSTHHGEAARILRALRPAPSSPETP